MKDLKKERITFPKERSKFFAGGILTNGLVLAIVSTISYIQLTLTVTSAYDISSLIANFSLLIFILSITIFLALCYGFSVLSGYLLPAYPYVYDGFKKILLVFGVMIILVFFYNYTLQMLLEIQINKKSFGLSAFSLSLNRATTLFLLTLVEVVVLGLMLINMSARYTIRLYWEAEELREFQQNAKIRFLQEQLNPHFLFNGLNTLLSEIDEEPERAKSFTVRLADVYRYNLHVQEKKTISLLEELRFLDSYIYVHKARLENGLVVNKVYPKNIDLNRLRVPPLALQILVENALKHNAASEKCPLELKVEISEDVKYIVVSNNIIPKKNLKKSLVGGLRNLSERYRLISGDDIFVVRSKEFFSVRIPLLDSE